MVRIESDIKIIFFNVVGFALVTFIYKLVDNYNTRTQSPRQISSL